MIDIMNIEKYRENNRIEAKKALGGLPHSIWETYSAFANTLGGIILLGVEEYRDKTLHIVDLPDPEGLIKEFWNMLNDPHKVSVNILTEKDVRAEIVNGHRIVVIEVPRAQRYDKPVYIDSNPASGSYRRTGEGDYHCTDEELRAMRRDAELYTQDMLTLNSMDMSVLRPECITEYRERMRETRPGHVWEALDDYEFLIKLGAAAEGEDGIVHPTAAGLLMFGSASDIRREYPHYLLEYRDGATERNSSSSVSSLPDCGNICDFYFRMCDMLTSVPPAIVSSDRGSVFSALREALANCLINADYYGQEGIVITKTASVITMSNPGDFRIGIDDAKSGGRSDPRNGAVMRMFNLIGVGASSGSGIPNIFNIWKKSGFDEPSIIQTFSPGKITLSLPLVRTSGGRSLLKRGGRNSAVITAARKETVVSYLTESVTATSAELCELLDLRPSRVRAILRELASEDIVISQRQGRNRIYRLKS